MTFRSSLTKTLSHLPFVPTLAKKISERTVSTTRVPKPPLDAALAGLQKARSPSALPPDRAPALPPHKLGRIEMGTADELRLENEWIAALDSLAHNSTETEADKQMCADIVRLKSRLNRTDEFLGSFLQTILDKETHDSRIVSATWAVRKYCRISQTNSGN